MIPRTLTPGKPSFRGFASWVERCVAALENAADYMHPDVRTNVHGAFGAMLTVCHQALGSPVWQPGFMKHTGPPNHPEQGVFLLPMEVRRHNNTALVHHLNTIHAERDKEVVAKAVDTLAETMELLGPESICVNADDLCDELSSLLRGKAPCQTYEDSDDEDGDEDHDYVLMEAVMDLVVAFAKVAGPEFMPAFEHMLKSILKYTRPGNDSKDRVMAIGTIAEVVKALQVEEACLPFVDRLFPVVSAGLLDGDHEVRRNAAFCAGVLCLRAPSKMVQHYPTLLQKIAPLFNDQNVEVVDNCCGAISNMITTSIQNVPIAEVLPGFLSKLPLKSDQEEIPTVCSALLVLIDSGSPVLGPHLQKMTEVLFSSLLANPAQLKEPMLGLVVQGAKKVMAAAPEAAQAASAAFGPCLLYTSPSPRDS
eukprot:TRINITY_DN15349_c0_g1_i7.p1 TRINITY_DN15349_c0_g1~~TRINITY_DN15349_c0_g1_i7.p1  ORF type:complete len:422 (+),score=88.73 TRINITY_DN15349_c0_g1_i7:463-1728(+)